MRRFIDNLRMAHKFLLVGAIALVMLAVPGAIVLRDGFGNVQTTRAEMAGLPPSGAMLKLVRLTQQHRGLANGMLAGNAAMAPTRQAKQAEVQQALAAAQAALATLGDDKLREQAARMASDWQALAGDVAGKSVDGAQSFARHTVLIADQLTLLEDIATSSGIVLEEEPAAYFMQAALLRALPEATEALGQMRARGAALLTRGQASAEDRARLEALAQRFQRAQRDSSRLLALASQHDGEIGKALKGALGAAQVSTEAALGLVDQKILRADKLDFAALDYFAAATRAIDDQFGLIDIGFKRLDEQLAGQAHAARNTLLALTAGLLLLAALGGWVMWVATRGTTAAVACALRLAEAVAAGDLRVQVPAAGRDEIGQLLRALAAMNQGLSRVVSGVRQNAESVATASQQIAQGNHDLSGRTEQQAAALQQTAATMDELGSTVRNTAEHAREANSLAQGAGEVAQRGSVAMGQVVQTMKGINDSSRRIADITGTIDSIAFQTNILALNAAVEAARAGEQGRGFAVVAGEVRLLAQRAAEAAREIKQLIATSVESVEQGSLQVDHAGDTMADVVTAIDRVRGIVAEISGASAEQSAGVSQVGEAVTQMDQATQQNAALVEESAAAAESLRQQAQQLVQAVSSFRLDEARAAPALPHGA
ncbi:MAG: nitrate- and nitrite sensing domain-containing protein [Burkholderiaceae bacterium]|nr:nitrate- and nitrite sensing domain-containing protein [Burkholderiaceae bacterium]